MFSPWGSVEEIKCFSFFLNKGERRRKCVCTLLEVCPATASDQQSIPSENHALILHHQRHTAISVSWCLPNSQILQQRIGKI